MTHATHSEERLLDLLVQRALEGLNDDEQAELAVLLRRHPEVNPDQFDGVIAALDALPLEADLPPLPATLAEDVQRRIAADAPAPPTVAANDPSFGWWAAAAASVLAVLGWWTAFQGRNAGVVTPAPTVAAVPARAVGTIRRAVDADQDALVVPFSATDNLPSDGVSGAVHWSHEQQLGYMRFVGLQANDPAVEQYQLWIFDGTRDDAHPVDGGVFDIGADGEIVVPIAAKLLVRDATLFAVTVEPPGGVVVSDRERLILVAQAP